MQQRGGGKPFTLASMIAVPFMAMAAIPVILGAVIFAPAYIPLAWICTYLEEKDKESSSPS